MKRFLFLFFILFIFNHVFGYNSMDSTRICYSIYENDTIYTKHYSKYVVSGITCYNNENLVDYNNISPDFVNVIVDEYIQSSTHIMIQEILDGYGILRCEKLIKKLNSRTVFFVRIRINLEGAITCVQFMYRPSLGDFMTYEDIKRNSQILLKSSPTPILAKYGMKLSPWITFPLGKEHIQEYLNNK